MGNAEIKLPFGINAAKRIVHINDVERGRACDCTCPGYGVPLTAAKGSVRQHHFRHAIELECVGAAESAIHLAAKQMLRERKQLNLPEHRVEAAFFDSRGQRHCKTEMVVRAGKVAVFDSVEEEANLHGMRADLLAIEGNRPLIIEIRFRHPVDENKRAKIVAANVSAIEIDLSDLSGEQIADWPAFWALINDRSRMTWLHNAKEKQVHEKLQKRLPALKAACEKRHDYMEQNQLRKAISEMQFHQSAAHLAALSARAESHYLWQYHKRFLRFGWNELPTFVDLSVPNGDWIYGCDRRLWQIAVYSNWIVKKQKSFSLSYVDSWLQDPFVLWVPACVGVITDYGPKYPGLLAASDHKHMPSTLETLNAYCKALCDLGILRYSGRDRGAAGSFWYSVQRTEPLASANQQAA